MAPAPYYCDAGSPEDYNTTTSVTAGPTLNYPPHCWFAVLLNANALLKCTMACSMLATVEHLANVREPRRGT